MLETLSSAAQDIFGFMIFFGSIQIFGWAWKEHAERFAQTMLENHPRL